MNADNLCNNKAAPKSRCCFMKRIIMTIVSWLVVMFIVSYKTDKMHYLSFP